MSNYTKSFNFRNGVQVDDSNFVVNTAGLVGIGTTLPTKRLDVRGNVEVSGTTDSTNLDVSNKITVGSAITMDATSGFITATKFIGDASGLTNIVAIATDGWIANTGTLSTTANIGIGTLSPTTQLDVLGATQIVGLTTLNGITTSIGTLFVNQFSSSSISTFKNLKVTGLSTFSGITTQTSTLFTKQLNTSGVSTFGGAIDANAGATIDNVQIGVSGDNEIDTFSGDLTLDSASGQTKIDDNVTVTGIITANNFSGPAGTGATFSNGINVTGISTFSKDIGTGDVVIDVGAASTFKLSTTFDLSRSGSDTYINNRLGDLIIDNNAASKDVKIYSAQNFEVFTSNTEQAIKAMSNGSVELYHNEIKKFETIGAGASVYGRLNIASLNGGASGLSSYYGSLRYGNETGNTSYSNRKSLDLINYDSGNINYILNFSNLSGTKDFHWHRGTNTQLMTLTGIGGSLGIGKTNPSARLHVAGDVYFAGNGIANSDFTINGTLTGTASTALTLATSNNPIGVGTITSSKDIFALTGIGSFSSVGCASSMGINGGMGNFLDPSDKVIINSGANGGSIYRTNEIRIQSNGRIAIGTDRFSANSDLDVNARVRIHRSVSVGASAKSAVDFSDVVSIQDDGSGVIPKIAYMIPPKLTTAQRNVLVDGSTGVGATVSGAFIFNTNNNKLEVYTGSSWTPLEANSGGGEVNQNAFSNIAVSGQNTVEADSKQDTVTLAAAGGMTITTNSATDTITLSSALSTASASAPASANSTGTTGTIAYDSNYVYICTATNTWKRASLTTW